MMRALPPATPRRLGQGGRHDRLGQRDAAPTQFADCFGWSGGPVAEQPATKIIMSSTNRGRRSFREIVESLVSV